MQTERPRVAQTSVGAGDERVRMLRQKVPYVIVVVFGRGCKNQRVPPLLTYHYFKSFTLS